MLVRGEGEGVWCGERRDASPAPRRAPPAAPRPARRAPRSGGGQRTPRERAAPCRKGPRRLRQGSKGKRRRRQRRLDLGVGQHRGEEERLSPLGGVRVSAGPEPAAASGETERAEGRPGLAITSERCVDARRRVKVQLLETHLRRRGAQAEQTDARDERRLRWPLSIVAGGGRRRVGGSESSCCCPLLTTCSGCWRCRSAAPRHAAERCGASCRGGRGELRAPEA